MNAADPVASHAELRALCREAVEGPRSDAHLAGVALALAAVVPALLDELEAHRRHVERLEAASVRADRPIADYTCECCGVAYVPGVYDSCRCPACCMSCRYQVFASVWVRGRSCPACGDGGPAECLC
jgi:hypothetical protein